MTNSRQTVVKKELKPYEKTKAEIKMMLTYMDYHLDILREALQSEKQEEIDFQKSQLSQIRERLYELRYFRDR